MATVSCDFGVDYQLKTYGFMLAENNRTYFDQRQRDTQHTFTSTHTHI